MEPFMENSYRDPQNLEYRTKYDQFVSHLLLDADPNEITLLFLRAILPSHVYYEIVYNSQNMEPT